MSKLFLSIGRNDVAAAIAWLRDAHAAGVPASELGAACEQFLRLQDDPEPLKDALAALRRDLDHEGP